MPGVLILEVMAQAGGVFVGLSPGEETKNRICYFVSIDAVKFRKPVRPGDQLRIGMELISCKRGIWAFAGKAFVDGKLAAEAVLKATFAGNIN